MIRKKGVEMEVTVVLEVVKMHRRIIFIVLKYLEEIEQWNIVIM